jgi:hypothetical protein
VVNLGLINVSGGSGGQFASPALPGLVAITTLVPAPPSLVLLSVSLIVIGGVARRRRKA